MLDVGKVKETVMAKAPNVRQKIARKGIPLDRLSQFNISFHEVCTPFQSPIFAKTLKTFFAEGRLQIAVLVLVTISLHLSNTIEPDGVRHSC